MLKLFSLIAFMGLVNFVTIPMSQAQTATRTAYSEVRPNGSSFASSFEAVIPDGAFVDVINPEFVINIRGTSIPGSNFSDLENLTINNFIFDTLDLQTIEAAISRAIDTAAGSGTAPTTEEDIIGYIRAFAPAENSDNSDDAAFRGAYAEVRPNTSSFASSFEVIVPEGAVTIGLSPIVFASDIPDGTAGTNLTGLNSLNINNLFIETNNLQTIDAAISRAIDRASGVSSGTVFTTEEDITGYIRSYVGPEGIGNANTSLDVTLD